ncbi:MAG: class I SAM-dependent methyltransferase [Desulfomonilaceae bacterium]
MFRKLYRKIYRLTKRVINGETRQILWDVYYKLRGFDLGYVPLESLGINSETGSWHENSGGPDLENVMKNLPISPDDSIIDLGCGKGGALITFSRFSFKSIDGVDVSQELLLIARSNLSKLGVEKTTLFCSDAATFTDLQKYRFIYMFNPFPTSVMSHVVVNINESVAKYPRKLTIIYRNPVCHDIIVSNSDFRVAAKFDHFSIPIWVYENEYLTN